MLLFYATEILWLFAMERWLAIIPLTIATSEHYHVPGTVLRTV